MALKKKWFLGVLFFGVFVVTICTAYAVNKKSERN